jgi:hypothetical protein
MVAPWILKLLGLSILFYGGIFFNVKVVFDTDIPAVINIFIFVFLLVLIVSQLFIYRVRFGKYKYLIYTNRVDYEGKKPTTFVFSNFQQAELKQGMFDKFFNTGSIRLSKDFIIGPVSNVSQVKGYIEQMVKYYQSTQQRYRTPQPAASTGVAGAAPGATQEVAR